MSLRGAAAVGRAVEPAAVRAMRIEDLDHVIQVEASSYSHPWTRGQFLDSMSAGHDARVLGDAQEPVIGYSIVMPGVDEIHLLNLTVQRDYRRRGHAVQLLKAVIAGARQDRRQAVWLEVRAGNEAARALYQQQGFVVTGARPGYYPGREGREDAVLMSLLLAASDGEAG